jgi:hypothetical protein
MSESDLRQGIIEIRSDGNPVPFRIYNGYNKLIDQGIGHARNGLPYGLYTVVFDGLNVQRTVPVELSQKMRIATLSPAIGFPTIAPINGNRFSHEYHTEQLKKYGIKHGLAVLGRSTAGNGFGRVDISDLMLIDRAGTGHKYGRENLKDLNGVGCQFIHWDLSEGGYFLCWPRQGARGKDYFIYQPVPVIQGYLTCVFLPCLPPDGKPIRESMTIHFVPQSKGYDMDDPMLREAVHMSEILIQQQREGRKIPMPVLSGLARPDLAALDLTLALSTLTQLSYQMDLNDRIHEESDKREREAQEERARALASLMSPLVDGLWNRSRGMISDARIFAESLRAYGINEFDASITDIKWNSPPLLGTSMRILLGHDLKKACIEEGSLLEEAYVGSLQGRPYAAWKSFTAPDVMASLKNREDENALAGIVARRIEDFLSESAKFRDPDHEDEDPDEDAFVRKICAALRLPFKTVSTILRGMDSPVLNREPVPG